MKNDTNVNVLVKLRIPTVSARLHNISYKHEECHKGVVKSFFAFEQRFHLDMHVFGHGEFECYETTVSQQTEKGLF